MGLWVNVGKRCEASQSMYESPRLILRLSLSAFNEYDLCGIYVNSKSQFITEGAVLIFPRY